jgi:hypothetical protein
VDQGAHVINVSLEMPCDSQVLQWATNYADRHGVVVTSAGNANAAQTGYPARLTDTIAVAAVDNAGVRASFSNYGSEVTVSAPGVDIYSTYANGLFAWWSGTSQSAPIVTGQVALLVSSYPWLEASQYGPIAANTAINIDSNNPGFEGLLGSGRIDLLASVTSDPSQSEFGVNTLTQGYQSTANQSVAMSDSGDYVITWSSQRASNNNWNVFIQRFDAAGVSQGPATRVNTTNASDQGASTIGMAPGGEFVIAWEGTGEGDVYGVYARLYDASGVPQGDEFRANTYVTGNQAGAAAAMDAAGNFAIAWTSAIQDSSGSSAIYAQRYDASGTPQGGEFLVNTFDNGKQESLTMAMAPNGDFIVAWVSYLQDSDGSKGIYAQRYDSNGVPQGGEFQPTPTADDHQRNPAVAMDANGEFVIVWESRGQDANFSYGIFGQKYDSTGATVGAEFQANTTVANEQIRPSVGVDADGDFAVGWQSKKQDSGQSWGIFGQRYDTNGVAQGGEFLVNSTVDGDQRFPSVAMDADGDFVAVWTGEGIGDGDGVFGYQFD